MDDEIIDILQSNNFICVAGRPSIGKTSLMINISLKLAVNNKKILFYSNGVSTKDIKNRIVSNLSGIGTNVLLKNNELLNHQLARYTDILEKYTIIDDIFNDNKTFISDITNQLDNSYSLICIDNLSFNESMNLCSCDCRTLIQNIKDLCNDSDIPFIFTSNIDREIEYRNDKKQLYSDFGILTDITDYIISIYNESYFDERVLNNENEVEILIDNHITKNRNFYKYLFNKGTNRFTFIDNK